MFDLYFGFMTMFYLFIFLSLTLIVMVFRYIAPGQNMQMRRTKTENQEIVNISCTVYKVFPMPRMQLHKLNINGTEHRYTHCYKQHLLIITNR